MSDGLLDTNLFIHAMTTDEHSLECQTFLAALARGDRQARLDITVLHELTYAVPRYRKQMERIELGEYLRAVIEWPGVTGDKSLLLDTVERWTFTPGLGLVDAYLAARANIEGCPVYSKNVRELKGQGVTVPDPLMLASENGQRTGEM